MFVVSYWDQTAKLALAGKCGWESIASDELTARKIYSKASNDSSNPRNHFIGVKSIAKGLNARKARRKARKQK